MAKEHSYIDPVKVGQVLGVPDECITAAEVETPKVSRPVDQFTGMLPLTCLVLAAIKN